MPRKKSSRVQFRMAVKALMKSYFGVTTARPVFDFRDIRPKGAELITVGGKAPGPEPLKECLLK